MLKRTIAGFLGSLAVAGGCFASYEAVQFICVMAVSGRPVLSWWFQGLLFWFLAVPALVFGVHFLRFAIFPVTVVDNKLALEDVCRNELLLPWIRVLVAAYAGCGEILARFCSGCVSERRVY